MKHESLPITGAVFVGFDGRQLGKVQAKVKVEIDHTGPLPADARWLNLLDESGRSVASVPISATDIVRKER